jgi:hypothetical protein
LRVAPLPAARAALRAAYGAGEFSARKRSAGSFEWWIGNLYKGASHLAVSKAFLAAINVTADRRPEVRCAAAGAIIRSAIAAEESIGNCRQFISSKQTLGTEIKGV